jgi:hypothetical protein
VLQGVRRDRDFSSFKNQLFEFEIFSAVDQESAVRAAENFRQLRKQGLTVRKTADCLIATFCIRSGYSLLHRDRDFDAFEKRLGLSVIHP